MVRKKQEEEVEEEFEEMEDTAETDDTSPRPPSRGPQPPRLSITLPSRVRRKVRIAAAKADMEVSEWCKAVIVKAATMTLEKLDIE